MAWERLSEELDELFSPEARIEDALADWEIWRRKYGAEYEKLRRGSPERRAYKLAWARAWRLEQGMRPSPRNGAKAAGWAGLSPKQKARHMELHRLRRLADRAAARTGPKKSWRLTPEQRQMAATSELPVKELAALLGVSTRYVQRLRLDAKNANNAHVMESACQVPGEAHAGEAASSLVGRADG